MISGYGYGAAKVMLITDGASEIDVTEGKAFSGYAGDIIRGFCRAHQLHFQEMWLTAFIKERVNLLDWKENIRFLNPVYENILVEEINQIGPNVIVPMGELSFRFLTGLKDIRKYRGSVLPARPDLLKKPFIRIIPILGVHPYLNTDFGLRFISRHDFSKVKKNIDAVGPIKEYGNLWIAETPSALRNFIERHYNKAKFLTFDIETICNVPTCIGFCFDGEEAVCVPFLDQAISFENRTLMLHIVAKLLASPIPKINQNIKFDWIHEERFGRIVNNVVGDTVLAASVIYPEFPRDLGFLTSIYTDMPYHKDEGKEYIPGIHDKKRFYFYNAKDCLTTHIIYQKQLEELEELKVKPVYDHLIQILPIYKKMEENGIRIDESRRASLYAKYESIYESYCYKLKKLAWEEINPLSWKQCDRFIFDTLGFKKTRGISGTDEESLELLAWTGDYNSTREAREILKTIIGCRKLKKLLEYLKVPVHPDGRMRCNFNLGGTETGRTSGSSTTDYLLSLDGNKVVKTKLGRSFQTIPKHGFLFDGKFYGKDIRSIFVPSRGYAFVECDLSQAEARVDAVLAADFDILPVFDGPYGIHRLTGSWVFDCKPEDIKKGTLEYHTAKTVRHAAERNMQATRLMLMLHQELAKCKEILNKFHARQPNIANIFHKGVIETIQRERCLIAPNGRRRDFFGRLDHNTFNQGISQLPQAIVTDQLKSAIYPSCHENKWARPLAEAHDGFFVEVPIGREVEWGLIFKKNVETPIDFRKCSLSRDYQLIIPMECETSTENWQEMKGLKLP